MLVGAPAVLERLQGGEERRAEPPVEPGAVEVLGAPLQPPRPQEQVAQRADQQEAEQAVRVDPGVAGARSSRRDRRAAGRISRGRTTVMPRPAEHRPRRERVAHAAQRGRQVRVVPGQHRRHVVVVDPAHPLGGVDGGREVGGEEPVALQPPRRHQDEDPERGVAEPEPGRRRLGVQAHREVDVLDRVVDRRQLRGRRRVLGQVVERPGRGQAQQPAELVVAGHAALAGAQDVHGGEVDLHAVRRGGTAA